jgi:HSP20 family protein
MWSLPDADDLAADVRRLFDDLDRTGHGVHPGSSLHAPPLDVVETAEAIEILVDVPGVSVATLRLVFKEGTLILAGEKLPPAGLHDGSAFQLVERTFGRFARVVRLDHAVDTSRARAILRAGVLRVSVPRIADRRGREVAVPVEALPT